MQRLQDGVENVVVSRIGIYGGTFDPIHGVHLQIARAAAESARLDKVLFVVAARPPHKEHDTSATPEQRMELVYAALHGDPVLEPSRIEVDREGPSYTADTLDRVAEEHPDAELFLIVGLDSAIDIPNWHDPDRILKRARLIVVPRPGNDDVLPDALVEHAEMLPFHESEVSSTEVRRRLAEGAPTDDILPEDVRAVIEREGLYDVSLPDTSR